MLFLPASAAFPSAPPRPASGIPKRNSRPDTSRSAHRSTSLLPSHPCGTRSRPTASNPARKLPRRSPSPGVQGTIQKCCGPLCQLFVEYPDKSSPWWNSRFAPMPCQLTQDLPQFRLPSPPPFLQTLSVISSLSSRCKRLHVAPTFHMPRHSIHSFLFFFDFFRYYTRCDALPASHGARANRHASRGHLPKQLRYAARHFRVSGNHHRPFQILPELFVPNLPLLKRVRNRFANLHQGKMPRRRNRLGFRRLRPAQNKMVVAVYQYANHIRPASSPRLRSYFRARPLCRNFRRPNESPFPDRPERVMGRT